jgi:lipopolysaccharide transport system ATP-binding protein
MVATDGSIRETVDAYLSTLEQVESQDLATRTDRRGRGQVRLTGINIFDGNNATAVSSLRTGYPARFVFQLNGFISGMSCLFVFFNHLGQRVALFKSDVSGPKDAYDSEIGASFVCEFEQLLLMPGRYYVTVLIRGGGEWQDHVEAAKFFDVQQGQLDGRPIQPDRTVSACMPHRWMLPLKD